MRHEVNLARRLWQISGVFILTMLLACGSQPDPRDSHDPTHVKLGETTFVVVINPSINDINDVTIPEPGAVKADIDIDGSGQSVLTGSEGIGILGGVDAGSVELRFRSGEIDAALIESIAAQDLIELAVSVTPDGASRMARVVYAFGAEVVELGSDSTIEQVNDALSASDRIVFLSDGIYVGDLELSGSSVTLFGAGAFGGRVTIEGDVTVSGSGNRIRGAHITGTLDLSGSNAGLSFSTIDGDVTVSGSDSVLLQNTFCGTVDVGGSGTYALGNLGVEPLTHTCP